MAFLIVNADDLGIAPPIDEGIFTAHREGIVTSTTVFVTSDRFDVVMAKAHRQALPTGVHLNLTLGRSVLPHADIPMLTTPDGFFRLTSRDLPRLLGGRRPNKTLLDQVRSELDAQLARAKDSGYSFTHFDSHQHVHMIPAVFALLEKLAPAHGFTRTRTAIEPLTLFNLSHKPLATLLRKNHLKWLWLRAAARSIADTFDTPDAFYGIMHSGLVDASTLKGILRSLPRNGLFELGIHPGLPCTDEAAAYPQPFVNDFIASPARRLELEAATAKEVLAELKALDIRLVSFEDVPPGGHRNVS